MINYLNQIESDLYKLNSITNGSGEVVEMVTELKEKYRKAEAWDKLKEKTIKVIDTIKAGKNQDVMSAVSAGVLSGIINYMNKVDEESKEDIEDERI